MEERRGLIRWIKKHRTELVIAGIGIGAVLLTIWGIRNKEEIKALWDSLRKVVEQPTVKAIEAVAEVTVEIPQKPIQEVTTVTATNLDSLPFEVRSHIRNLPAGQHASPEKIAEALEHNINLGNGQTWVDGYTKRGVAA